MLIIRLQRVGRKNDPSFRVVVTDSKNAAKSGKFLEVLGSYNARKTAQPPVLKAERIKYWLSVGAQMSDTVKNLLISKKIIDGKKINISPVKPPKAKPEEAKPAVEAKETPAEEVATEESVAETASEEVVTETVPEEAVA